MSQHARAASASAKARQIARPMPPPAPLTSATFPVSFIAALPMRSEHYRAAVDGDRLAGDKAAGVRDQPSHRADEVGRGQGALDRLAGFDHLEPAAGLV